MWIESSAFNLPRTRTRFEVSDSTPLVFVKPGKAYSLGLTGSWTPMRSTSILNNKIDRLCMSPSGQSTVHLPKVSPMLAVHRNDSACSVISIPFPDVSVDGIAPDGTPLKLTNPLQKTHDVPFLFGGGQQTVCDLCNRITGLSISDSGNMVAMAHDEKLWVWQQIPSEAPGIGFWTDLTADSSFTVRIDSNHPTTVQTKLHHGSIDQRQYYTQHPVIAPNVPQNSAISHQSVMLFDNPDEGHGICCLTAVLPPCKPFDTLFLFNAVCTFSEFRGSMERYEVSLSIDDGAGSPCSWWSPCGRVVVVAVSRSIVILTRTMRVLKVLSVDDVFLQKNSYVSSIAWSCSGMFFVVTSTCSEISCVSRAGDNLKHSVCDLSPFQDFISVPLFVSPSGSDPSSFIVYSRDKARHLSVKLSKINPSAPMLMSLNYPNGNVEQFFGDTKSKMSDLRLVELLYYTGLFCIFPLRSPLRYMIWTLLVSHWSDLMKNGNHLLALLLARCIFLTTGLVVDGAMEIVERLGSSPRDKMIRRILEFEFDKGDWVKAPNQDNQRLHMDTDTEMFDDYELSPPPMRREVDVYSLIETIKSLLYTDSFDITELNNIPINASLLLDLIIDAGQFKKAMDLSKHPSITESPITLFRRIVSIKKDNALFIYHALQMCCEASPADEFDLKAVALESFISILKDMVMDSKLTNGISKLCHIEEYLQAVIPLNEGDCNDFAAVVSMCLSAVGFNAVSDFINGRSTYINSQLRKSVQELFGILWFIRLRYIVSNGGDSNFTLRLLAFPEFVNQDAALAAIKRESCDPDLYELYYRGNRDYTLDEKWDDFITDCTKAFTQRVLKRIHDKIMSFKCSSYEFPNSQILVTLIVSHLVPWLRCAIPRALEGFDVGEDVPPSLLAFEPFELPPRKQLHITPPESVTIATPAPAPTPSEPSKKEPPKQETPRVEPQKDEISIDDTSESDSDELSEGEISEEPVKVKKTRKHRRPRERVPKRRSKGKEKKKIRLLRVDKVKPFETPRFDFTPMIPLQSPMIPQQSPSAAFVHQYDAGGGGGYGRGSLWDINPDSFSKKPPVVKPPPTPLATESKETQKTTDTKPPVVFVNYQRPKNEKIYDSSTSDDIEDDPVQITRETLPSIDPYPLNDELLRRANALLDEIDRAPPHGSLPPKPTYKPTPIPVVPIDIKQPRPSPLPEEIKTNWPAPPEPKIRTKQREWKPSVITVGRPPVVDIAEISPEEFRSGNPPVITTVTEIPTRPAKPSVRIDSVRTKTVNIIAERESTAQRLKNAQESDSTLKKILK